jgi:hypothetical protein
MLMRMLVDTAHAIQRPILEVHLIRCIGDVKLITGHLSLSKIATYELSATH